MILKTLILTTPFLLYFCGYLLLNSYDFFGICIGGEITSHPAFPEKKCWGSLIGTAHAIKFAALYLFPITVLLFFSSKEIIKVWWTRFTIWFIPLGMILFLIINKYPYQFWPIISDSLSFVKTFGILFVIISALIIFFGNRKKNS